MHLQKWIMKLYEAIILLLLGAIGLYRGITNKGGALWSSFRGTGFGKKLMGDDYTRMINILAGVLCLIIGISYFFKKS